MSGVTEEKNTMQSHTDKLASSIDNLFNAEKLSLALKNKPDEILGFLKQSVSDINDGLKESYQQGSDVEDIVFGRSNLIDQFLETLFDHIFVDVSQSISLIAVGGYGRGELHPGSDIDLMLLLKEEENDTTKDCLEKFLTLLWDSRLEIGHSVRTLTECVAESEKDITVATNIMEARLITGDEKLFTEMKQQTGPDKIWDSSLFFQTKLDEQIQRSGKFNDTAYSLEPNIKESHGGLRDIQMIGWVAKRHFGAETLQDLVEHKFILQSELESLMSGQHLLWRIRCSLHFLAGRREDRLLFDYQRQLAEEFGFEDSEKFPNYAIEQFMQQYYRTVMRLERLNEMLLQLFREAILHQDDIDDVVEIDQNFQIRHGYIEVRDEDVFKKRPAALLEIFYVMTQYPEIQGVRAETIRLMRGHRYLVNDEFRNSKESSQIFINILRQNRGITHELRRMNRYGLLAAYIPAFESIVGRMQYDLFHAYTVDQHTLFVVRNLRRFAVPDHCHEFPLASGIIHHLKYPELLYLAGLFHDIAKGRDGDHSELGQVDAYEFCIQHGISEKGAQLVGWLVKSHLMMSMTAQSKDISDPDVISNFAKYVGDIKHLDNLYLLTVADIRGTNPKQWNSWKDNLLIELYNKTAHVLRIGHEHQADKQETILQTQTDTLRNLETSGFDPVDVHAIWSHFDDDYFIRQTADEIFWHTQLISKHESSEPLIETRYIASTNTLELLVYAKTEDMLFASIVTLLSQMELDVADAQIRDCANHYSLDTFKIHFADRTIDYIKHVEKDIRDRLPLRLHASVDNIPAIQLSKTRTQKHFDIKTKVTFEDLDNIEMTRMQIETANQQGILAIIARIFIDCGIKIHSSKISTIGEKALDYFDITDKKHSKKLSEKLQTELKDQLIKQLQ